jgi:hypothetical protein
MSMRGEAPGVFSPDMGRDLYDPDLIFSNIARDRGEAVYDDLPPRVRAVLRRLEDQAGPDGAGRGWLSAVRRMLG